MGAPASLTEQAEQWLRDNDPEYATTSKSWKHLRRGNGFYRFPRENETRIEKENEQAETSSDDDRERSTLIEVACAVDLHGFPIRHRGGDRHLSRRARRPRYKDSYVQRHPIRKRKKLSPYSKLMPYGSCADDTPSNTEDLSPDIERLCLRLDRKAGTPVVRPYRAIWGDWIVARLKAEQHRRNEPFRVPPRWYNQRVRQRVFARVRRQLRNEAVWRDHLSGELTQTQIAAFRGTSVDTVQRIIKRKEQDVELVERIERMEHKLDRIVDDCAETAQRLRERFPNNEEVSDAVEQFLVASLEHRKNAPLL